jgi:acyl carrier protein
MNDLHQVVRDAIYLVAPDVDPAGIAGDVDFREAAGLDSMDLLNVLTEIARATGIEVPEADYASVATIDSLAAYLAAHQPV